jgi:hypothetical protein
MQGESSAPFFSPGGVEKLLPAHRRFLENRYPVE